MPLSRYKYKILNIFYHYAGYFFHTKKQHRIAKTATTTIII